MVSGFSPGETLASFDGGAQTIRFGDARILPVL
jgi:hypothetical protein